MSDQAMNKLIVAMRDNFTDTELHVFVITASQPMARNDQHWQRLGYAATQASDCRMCAVHSGFTFQRSA